MDVHPPHEPIHSWRDFFIHLATITIGLLIALGLEAIVEWAHHRTLVHEAHHAVRQEFEANHKRLERNLNSVRSDEQRIADDIKLLVSMRAGNKVEHGSLEYTVSWSSFSDSAWKATQSSGVLSYLDFKSARELADVYSQQDFVSNSAIQIYRDHTLAIAPLFISNDPNKMSPQEIQVSLERSADLLLGLRLLEQTLTQLDGQYKEQLKHS